jgi:hypothetical protein
VRLACYLRSPDAKWRTCDSPLSAYRSCFATSSLETMSGWMHTDFCDVVRNVHLLAMPLPKQHISPRKAKTPFHPGHFTRQKVKSRLMWSSSDNIDCPEIVLGEWLLSTPENPTDCSNPAPTLLWPFEFANSGPRTERIIPPSENELALTTPHILHCVEMVMRKLFGYSRPLRHKKS